MKTISLLAVILMVSACAGTPPTAATADASKASVGNTASVQKAGAVSNAAARPAPAKPEDQVVTTGKTKRICENDDTTGSRLKRPRCVEVPEGNEKAYREDLLREKDDELRRYNEQNAIRTTNDVFAK